MSKANSLPSIERLKELLNYDHLTGIFTWKVAAGKSIRIGSVAGSLNHGYYDIGIDGPRYRSHRLAWLYYYGKEPTGDIDHINRIKSDNRIKNLRIVNGSTNAVNVGLRKNNRSGIIGVNYLWLNNRWIAHFSHQKTRYYVGLFKTKRRAVHALAKRKLEIIDETSEEKRSCDH